MRHIGHRTAGAACGVVVSFGSHAFAADPAATDPGQYVLYLLIAGGVLAALGATVLFPSSRRKRQSLRQRLAARLPFLPSVQEQRHAAKMDELRDIAGEPVRGDRAGGIEIQPLDFGRMALPSEQTVDASFGEMPALEEVLERAEAQARRVDRRRAVDLPVDEVAVTREALPLAVDRPVVRDLDLSGEDDIPFDLLDPMLKPQLQSSKYDDDATQVRDAEVRAVLRDAPTGRGHHVRGLPDVDQTVAASIRPLTAYERNAGRRGEGEVFDLIDTLDGE